MPAVVAIAAALATIALLAAPAQAAHADASYLAVPADGDALGGTSAGSTVAGVAVRDPAILGVAGPAGGPSVLADGEPLRMVQGTDGSWCAYFAD